jgi:hypothetical protein
MVTGIIRTLGHQEVGAAEMLQRVKRRAAQTAHPSAFCFAHLRELGDRERRLQIANSGLPLPHPCSQRTDLFGGSQRAVSRSFREA